MNLLPGFPRVQAVFVRVVYPIEYTDGHTEFWIGERYDVLKNLYAHLSNNLMNETFGICKNRYDATPDQKKKIAEQKKNIMNRAKELGDTGYEFWMMRNYRNIFLRHGQSHSQENL